MQSFSDNVGPTATKTERWRPRMRWLASLQLGVILIVLLAAVLAGATFLEAAKGREFVQWHIYKSQWFIGLLAIIAANVFAAAAIRFPWKKRQIGFLVTHAGILVLLAGSIQTFLSGLEGTLSVVEGVSADSILMPNRCVLRAIRSGQDGRQLSTELAFSPGPSDWAAGKNLDFGEADGLGIKVTGFYRHARDDVRWIADDEGPGDPAFRFALLGPDGKMLDEDWLASKAFGGPVPIGPVSLQLSPISTESMVADFLEPPTDGLGEGGILSMHYKNQMHRIPVQENVGRKVPVGDSDVLVEIAEYLANAVPDNGGRFSSRGDTPRNPLLELRIHLPGNDEPLRQIAFAKFPFLNLDGVHGGQCPVKFWYHHPAGSAESGAEFVRAPDGKLYCRVGMGGKHHARGEVKAGDQIELAAGFKVALLDYLPRARRQVTFAPVELAPGETGGPEPAVQVEVTVAGTTEQLWLRRNDQQYGFRKFPTAEGALTLLFEYEYRPLGFSLKLHDFQREPNPGRMGNASFRSSVQLTDLDQEIDEKREISMNQPLVHGKFSFYQSSYQELPDGREASILTAAYDPGRFLKYLGSLMLCVGTCIMFCGKARHHGRRSTSSAGREVRDAAQIDCQSGQAKRVA